MGKSRAITGSKRGMIHKAVTGKKEEEKDEVKDTPEAIEYRHKRFGSLEMPCPSCHEMMKYDEEKKTWLCRNTDCKGDKIQEAIKHEVEKDRQKKKANEKDDLRASVDRFRKAGTS